MILCGSLLRPSSWPEKNIALSFQEGCFYSRIEPASIREFLYREGTEQPVCQFYTETSAEGGSRAGQPAMPCLVSPFLGLCTTICAAATCWSLREYVTLFKALAWAGTRMPSCLLSPAEGIWNTRQFIH